MQPKANANTGAKGKFLGVKKTHVKKMNTMKGAKTANRGASNFGQATPMGGGKHNYSNGVGC